MPKRETRVRTTCSRCKRPKNPNSLSYCRPCANAYYQERKEKKGRRTFPAECYRCGKKKSIYHSFCGSCNWKNTKSNKPIGYPTCVQCGSAKNPTTFRYCSVCAKQRSEERALRLGYVRKNPVCSKCGQESATVNQSYCRPCAREYERARNREDPSKNRAKANNRRSRIRSACGTFSKTEWKALLKRLGEKCFYCGNKSKELTADHVIPLDAGGCNFIYNIRPACRSCNSRKRTKILDDVQFSLFDKIA